MKNALMKSDAHEQETQRITRELHRLIRIQERSQRSVEQELGLGSAVLSKMLNGTIRLQVSHVFMLLDVLGISPGQFFRYAYPKEEKEHPSLAKLRELNGEAEEVDSPEFDDRVRRALVRLLGEPLRSEA
jgi:transcriptional regulator with XRE-family HTH domain